MEKAVLSPYEQLIAKIESLHKLDELKSEADKKYAVQQYDDVISQQTKVNEQTLINAKDLAAIT